MAFHCMTSMLQAIGNLALYKPNVQVFLDNEVEKTFAHLFENSRFLPDNLLLASLKTMSNLVFHHNDDCIEKFGITLVPLLTMLQQSTHKSIKMLTLAFEALGNLCRLPNNARQFVGKNLIQFLISFNSLF